MSPGPSLRRRDFWRRDLVEDPRGVPFKEWHHFILRAGSSHLLINFSLTRDGTGQGQGRVIALACGEDPSSGWRGAVGRAGPAALAKDGCDFQLQGQRLRISDEGWTISLSLPEAAIAADLRVTPAAHAMNAPDQSVGGGRRLSWLVFPRVKVDGRVTIEGRSQELVGVIGYHDHNWGRFSWGDDYAWEWGILWPDDDAIEDGIVVSSLQNRARTTASLEQLFLWRGGRSVAAMASPELSVDTFGRHLAPAEATFPPVMSLLEPPTVRQDIPRRLRWGVERSDRALAVDMTVERVARLLVPSETDPLGVLAIFECLVSALAEGHEGGTPWRWEGRGIVELVRG